MEGTERGPRNPQTEKREGISAQCRNECVQRGEEGDTRGVDETGANERQRQEDGVKGLEQWDLSVWGLRTSHG